MLVPGVPNHACLVFLALALFFFAASLVIIAAALVFFPAALVSLASALVFPTAALFLRHNDVGRRRGRGSILAS